MKVDKKTVNHLWFTCCLILFFFILIVGSVSAKTYINGQCMFVHARLMSNASYVANLTLIKQTFPEISCIEVDYTTGIVNSDNTTDATNLASLQNIINIAHNYGFKVRVKLTQYDWDSWFVNGTYGDIYIHFSNGTSVTTGNYKYSLFNPWFQNYFNLSAVIIAQNTSADELILGNEINYDLQPALSTPSGEWYDWNPNFITAYQNKLQSYNPSLPYWSARYNSVFSQDFSYVLNDTSNSSSESLVFLEINNTNPTTSTLSNTTLFNASGLVAYYKFDEGHGNTTGDASGNGNNGTLINMNTTGNSTSGWTNGYYNNGLLFNGISDYVNGTTIMLNNTATWSVSLWFKILNSSDVMKGLVAEDSSSGAKKDYIMVNGSCFLQVGTYNDAGSATTSITTTKICNPNTWTHIVVAKNNPNCYVYVNGILNATLNCDKNGGQGSPQFRIGTQRTSYFNGTIDEVRAYNITLTSSQALNLYNNQSQHIFNNTMSMTTGNYTWKEYIQFTNRTWLTTSQSSTYVGWNSFSNITPSTNITFASSNTGNQTQLLDWMMIKNQLVAYLFNSVAQSVYNVNPNLPTYVCLIPPKLKTFTSVGNNIDNDDMFLPYELAKRPYIDGVAYNAYLQPFSYNGNAEYFNFVELASAFERSGKRVILSETGWQTTSSVYEHMKWDMVSTNYFDGISYYDWDTQYFYNFATNDTTTAGKILQNATKVFYDRINDTPDVYVWFPYSATPLSIQSDVSPQYNNWLGVLSRLNIRYQVVDNVTKVPINSKLIIYLPKTGNAGTSDITENNNPVFNTSGVYNYLNNTLLPNSKVLVIGFGVQSTGFQPIRNITGTTDTSWRTNPTCVLNYSNMLFTLQGSCANSTLTGITAIYNYTDGGTGIMTGKSPYNNVTTLLFNDGKDGATPVLYNLTYNYLKDFLGLNPIYNTTEGGTQIYVRKSNNTLYIMEWNNSAGSFNISNTYSYNTLWDLFNHKFISQSFLSSLFINDTIGAYELKTYKVFNFSSFNLTQGQLAKLYDTSNNLIDDQVPVQISSATNTNISINSTQNYTNVNLRVNVSSLTDLTNFKWRYKAYNDANFISIPSANISYNGGMVFNLVGVNISQSNSSNQLIVGSPIWYNNQSVIASPAGINPSYFNVSVNDTNPFYVDTVIFESNYSGIPTNYSTTRLVTGLSRPSSYILGGGTDINPTYAYDNNYNDTTTYAQATGDGASVGAITYNYIVSTNISGAIFYSYNGTSGGIQIYNYTKGDFDDVGTSSATLTVGSKNLQPFYVNALGNVTLRITSASISGGAYTRLWDTYITGNQYSGTYNYNGNLPSGAFYWKFYANSSDGGTNVTDTWFFTILPANTNNPAQIGESQTTITTLTTTTIPQAQQTGYVYLTPIVALILIIIAVVYLIYNEDKSVRKEESFIEI